MSNMPLYVEKKDVELILAWLREDPDIAIIMNFGEGENKKKKWKAVIPPVSLEEVSYWIWHIPSGPVVFPGVERKDPDWIEVSNPFEEYQAVPYATHLELQNVGNRAQFFELELKIDEPGHPDLIGLSNLSWIGSNYEKAPESAKKWWSKLRRFITKNSIKVSGNGINSHENSKFPCFPHAYQKINQ